MDQFLGPFYDRDLDAGRISREEAAELLEATWLKLLAIKKIRSWSHTRYSAGGPLYQNVTIGGVDRDGKDATNRLSSLILETVGELRLTQPNLSVRYHSGMTRGVPRRLRPRDRPGLRHARPSTTTRWWCRGCSSAA